MAYNQYDKYGQDSQRQEVGTTIVVFREPYQTIFGVSRSFDNTYFHLSTSGVAVVRDKLGNNKIAYPEGVWATIETL